MSLTIKQNLICPSCGKKAAYQFINTGIIKCSACGLDTTNEYKERKKLERQKKTENETTLELVDEYRRSTQKHHRLSDNVIKTFNINAATHTLKDGRARRSLILSNYNNRPVKFLSRSSRVKPIWMSLQSDSWWYLPRKIKEIDGKIYVVEGPWDVFALYDALGTMSICPLNGAGSITASAISQIQDEIFDREIVIIFNNDKAGRAGVEKAAKNLLEIARPKSVSICDLSEITGIGGDIDDLVQQGKIDELRQALETQYVVSVNTVASRWPLPKIPIPFYDSGTVKKIWQLFSLAGIEREQAMIDIAFGLSADPTLAKKEFYRIKAVYSEMLSYAISLSIQEVIEKYKIVRWDADIMVRYSDEPWRMAEDHDFYRITCEVYGLAFGVNAETPRKKADVEHVFYSIFNSVKIVEFNKPNQIFFKTKIFDSINKNFRDYDEDDYFSMRLDFDPESSTSEIFNATIDSWLGEDAFEFKKLLWHVMSRQRFDHKFFVFVGPGGDGKGEAAKLLESLVLKTSYVPIGHLLCEKNDPYLAAVNDCDLNISDELAVNGRVSEDALKRVTGGAKITIDRKYKTAITTKIRASYVMLSNTLPAISDLTDSFYQRLKVFEFKNTFRGTNKEKFNFFENVLLPELPKIAYTLCAMSIELDTPFIADTKTIEKVRQSSPIYSFWEEVFGSEQIVLPYETVWDKHVEAIGFNITDRYKKFKTFLKENGFSDTSSERFSRGSEEVLYLFLREKNVSVEKKSFRIRKASSRYICFKKIIDNNNSSNDYVSF